MERISKENYYLDIAETVLERATCLRRVYGAIIVKNDEIISTGYNGAPRGRRNCVDMGFCTRDATWRRRIWPWWKGCPMRATCGACAKGFCWIGRAHV